MPFSFSNLKSCKKERSLKGAGSCNSRTFNVDADNDDDDDDDNDDDDDGGGGCGGVNRELKQLRRRPQKNDFKKTTGLMIKTTALHLHHT